MPSAAPSDGLPESKRPRIEEHSDDAFGLREWNVRVGERASNISNPIRKIMDTMGGKSNPDKPMISLAQGDPTKYPHLRPHEVSIDAICRALRSGDAHGYQPSQGMESTRLSVAEFHYLPLRPAPSGDDIFMCVGCSEALSHSFAAVAFKGSNMLLPRPGFPLYEVLCDYFEIECRYYDLTPETGWQIDIPSLRKIADANTCAVLINNPSNPCGCVYSREHLTSVMQVVEELKLIVIADEVYWGMSFGEEKHIPCAAVAPKVPVLSVCALSKRWLAPGWRCGWVCAYDADGIMAKAGVQQTLLKLLQVSLGPSAPIQAAIPEIMRLTPSNWVDTILAALKASAYTCMQRCKTIPCLEAASDPQGAMYFMLKINPDLLRDIEDDVQFAGALLEEESVAVLPGQCFGVKNYVRVVFAAPVETIEAAWDRIEHFCQRRALP